MEEILGLMEVPGVKGAVFHRGKTIVANHFPKLYGNTAIEEMCAAIATSFTAYAQVGRVLTEELVYFAEGTLLIMMAPPKEGLQLPAAGELLATPFLTLLLETPSVSRNLLAPVRTFLLHQSRVDAEAWSVFEGEMIKLLGKVINRAQGEKLLARVLKSFAPEQTTGLPRQKFAEFGQAVIREVPNRAKHESLLSAMDKILTQLS
jgi:hypothetical protein